jgi:hypothetical protein
VKVFALLAAMPAECGSPERNVSLSGAERLQIVRSSVKPGRDGRD